MPESDSTILYFVRLEVCENKRVYSMCHDMKGLFWAKLNIVDKKNICKKANNRLKLET
jgi:hypothetical protein